MADNRILDHARLGQELDELNAELQVDLYEGVISPREVSEFQAVAAAIQAVLEEAEVGRMSQELTPALHAARSGSKVEHALGLLSPAQREAVKMLFTAATAHDAERGTYVSALERNTLLNQALMHLQPMLALALRPDFRDGHALYHDLVDKLNAVRKDIMSGILAQGTERPGKILDVDITTDEDDENEPDAATPAEPDAAASAAPDAAASAAPDAGPAAEPPAGQAVEPGLHQGAGRGAGQGADPSPGAAAAPPRPRRGRDREP